jgi:hypothetical protein
MLTERENTQTLEAVLNAGQASTEEAEVSEETETEETATDEAPKDEKTEEEKAAEARESEIRAEADKRTNSYREKREADTALIRSQSARIKELERKAISGL